MFHQIQSDNSGIELQYRFSNNILTEQKMNTNRNAALNIIYLDPSMNNNDFDIDLFETIDCSYLKYSGGFNLEKGFTCSKCNPTRNLIMCEYCYNNCHKDCTKLRIDELQEKTHFSCYCGEKLKHLKPEEPSHKRFKPCKILNFDKRIGNKKLFLCHKHSVKICSVCAKECHVNCDSVTPYNDDIVGCECMEKNNHNELNEFTLNFAKEETKKGKNEIMKDLWPIQVLNILFETRIYKKLEVFVRNQMECEREGESKYQAPFPRIIGLFSDIFNSKFKTFYYREEIIQLFKYSTLVNFIRNLDTSTSSAQLLKFRLLYLVLFLHLKKDFQLIKSLTSIDFISGNLLERILYKKYLFTRTIYTEDILDKYKLDKEDHPNYLNNFVLKEVSEFLRDAVSSELNFTKFQTEFEIGLKFLCFMLKRMLFKKAELEKIAEDLNEFETKLIDAIEKSQGKNNQLENLFKGVVELSLLLSVNYNDIVIYDYLMRSNKRTVSDDLEEFIHCCCETGENIFKIIIKNSKVIKKHYQANTQDEVTLKILIEYQSTMQLYSIVDNFYYKQIKNMTEEELEHFYDFSNKLDHSQTSFQDMIKEYEEKNDDIESGRAQLLNFNKQRVIPLKNKDTILETKMSIEIFLNNYFTESFNKPGEIYYSIYQEIENFLKKVNNSMVMNSKNEQLENTQTVHFSSLEEKIKNDYNIKVKTSISRFFFYVRRLNQNQLETYIEHFKFSNLDETLFKVLIIFSTGRYVNQITYESLDLCLAFLSIFFLSKKGMRYFLIGKNITRMHKLFQRFRLKKENKNISIEKNRSKQSNLRFTTRILEFIYLVAKGIRTFHLSLKYHKVLFRFRKNLIGHLECFVSLKDNDTAGTFKIHLNLITSILLCFRDEYNLEAFEEIKVDIWNLYKSAGLMYYERTNFLSDFVKEVDDMGRIVNLKEKNDKITEQGSTPFSKKKTSSANAFDLISESETSQAARIEDPFHTYFLSEVDPSKMTELNEHLYYNFFRMMTYQTYFTYTQNMSEIFLKLPSLDDLDVYKENFKNNNLSIKIRRAFIVYLYTFFFADYLDKYSIKKCERALTTSEFIEYEKKNKNEGKYNKLMKQEKVIEIIIQELSIFPNQILNFQDSIEEIYKYTRDLIFTTKAIADFYYNEKNIWCRSYVYFYNLIKELSYSMYLLKDAYTSIKRECILKVTNNKNDQRKQSNYYLTLCRRKFDIMDRDQLYFIGNKVIKEIFSGTNALESSSLETFLRQYDIIQDLNFSPPSFIETNDFEYFYTQDNSDKSEKSPIKQKIENILLVFAEQFTNFENTNIYEIISGIFDESDQIDYRKVLIEYFILFFKIKEREPTKLYHILCILNKMLFYDVNGTQNDLEKLKEDTIESQEFFTEFNALLHKMLIHTYTTCKNCKVANLFLLYSNVTKLLLQFLTLLGEGFNKDFHSKIFGAFPFIEKNLSNELKETNNNKNLIEMKKDNKVQSSKRQSKVNFKPPKKKGDIVLDPNALETEESEDTLTFYLFAISNLVQIYDFLNFTEQIAFEMPSDKLIVLCNNLVDLIMNYIDVNEEHAQIVNTNIEKLFSKNIFKFLLLKSNTNNKLRSDLICFIKTKFLCLVISYFQKGTNSQQIRRFTKLLSPSQIFEEILHHMQALFVFLGLPKLLPLQSEIKFINTLINYYVYDSEFRNSLQLNLCLKYFILIKFYEELYQISSLKNHFEKIQNLPDIKRDYYGLNTKFAYKISLFFEQLVLKVGIKRMKNNDQETDYMQTFFVRPHITYHLSNQTKESFEFNVDRSSTSSKLNELLFYSDYFSFEMATNARLLGKSLWSQTMRKVLMKYIELFSYLLLIVHNVIMICINYKDTHMSIEEYNFLDIDLLYEYDKENFYLAIFQAAFLVIVLIIWFYYKFPLYYMKSILRKTGKKFIFKKIDDTEEKENMQIIKDYFSEERTDIKILPSINKLFNSLTTLKKIELGVIDAFLNNREICILFYTLIFIIIYLSTACIIWLALPLLFLFNSVPTLYNVYSAVRNHLKALLSIVLMIIIVSYNFMWISFHFMHFLFYFETLTEDGETYLGGQSGEKEEEEGDEEVADDEEGDAVAGADDDEDADGEDADGEEDNADGEEEEEEEEEEEGYSEPMCSSPVQCLLHILEYFVIQQSPDTDYISFKRSPSFYLTNFFYDLLFYLLVSLILYNVFLGVLYDTFSELRGTLQEKENDKKNVCFICQLTRDGSIAKRIDFNEHVQKEHYLWNYVYFMIYLQISNSNDFDDIQSYVWEKLTNQDNSWIPQY